MRRDKDIQFWSGKISLVLKDLPYRIIPGDPDRDL